MEDLNLFPDLEDFSHLNDDGLESLEIPDISENILKDTSLQEVCKTPDPPSSKAPAKVIKVLIKPKSEEELLEYLTSMANGKTDKDNGKSAKEEFRINVKTVSKNGDSITNRKPSNIIVRCQNHNQGKTLSNESRKSVNGTLSKNALLARENRQKKKKYIEDLKNNLEQLQSENKLLNESSVEKEKLIEDLQKENAYLKNVLANVNEISALLTSVKKTPGLKFTTSLLKNNNSKRKHESENENQSTGPSKKGRRDGQGNKISSDNEMKGGVCLHVSSGHVSLEFCPSCSINAGKVWGN